ncbi:hypothetical protein Tco_0431219 [Tanacetum coccineum]
MLTKMELTLEQTQQGVSYEVSSDTQVITMKMEILLEPTSNKLMVGTPGDGATDSRRVTDISKMDKNKAKKDKNKHEIRRA